MVETLYNLVLLIAFIYGACLGSFATALLWRVPRGLPWVTDQHGHPVRSACPACGTTLGPKDLWPLLSWLLSKGKCRHCGNRISVRYPLIELGCGLAALGAIHITGPVVSLFVYLLALPFLLTFLYGGIKYHIWPLSMLIIVGILVLAGWLTRMSGI